MVQDDYVLTPTGGFQVPGDLMRCKATLQGTNGLQNHWPKIATVKLEWRRYPGLLSINTINDIVCHSHIIISLRSRNTSKPSRQSFSPSCMGSKNEEIHWKTRVLRVVFVIEMGEIRVAKVVSARIENGEHL